MKTMRRHYPLPLMSRVFDVLQSGYHAWGTRRLSKPAQQNTRLEVAIHAAHQRTRQTYSAERLQSELAADGFHAGVGRIKRLRKKLGICCKHRRKFKATTHSNHRLPVAPNLLDQQFAATRPNEVWVTDITYVATGEGWIYLAGIKDIYTYDNAPMESFWGTLKNELVHHRCYETRQQAISEITEYIEIFYNRQRRHSRLGYLAPAVFAKQFYQQQEAA